MFFFNFEDSGDYFPRMCWGSLFNLMLGAAKPRANGNDRIHSKPGKVTNPNLVRSLVAVLDPKYKINEKSFSQFVSSFRKCEDVKPYNLPFDDPDFVARTHKNVTADAATYVETANRMKDYVEEYLLSDSDNHMNALASRIVGTVDKDETINWDGEGEDVFYVDPKHPDGLTKRELVEEKHFSMPCLLLGMWEYVIRKQEGYTVGADTFNHWHKEAGSNQSRELKDKIDVDDDNNRGIITDNEVSEILIAQENSEESEVEPAVVPDADQNGVVDYGSEDADDKIVDFGDEDQESSEDSADDGSADNTDDTSPKELVIPGVKLLFPQSWSQDEIDEFMSRVDYTAPDKDPVWPADLDPEAYSLLMAHTIDFTSGSIELDRDRCGKTEEYSDEELVAQYGAFTHDQMQDICRMPVLLMEENKPEAGYETRVRKIAYVGICTKINKMTGMYRFRWTMLFAFPQDAIEPAIDYLDIDSNWPHGEMRRTHQAFKYVNLCETLREEVGIDIPVPVEQSARGPRSVSIRNGDYVQGNKIMGDYVQGHKIGGDLYTGPVTINKTEQIVAPTAQAQVHTEAPAGAQISSLNYPWPLIKSDEFFNIIVSEDFDPAKHVLTVNKKMTLRPKEYTEDTIFHNLCRLQGREMEEIHTYRTMFMQPLEKEGDDFAPNQNIYFGYVVLDVKEKADVFEVTYVCRDSLPVKYLADFLDDIGVDSAPYHIELMDAHWAIKRGDLRRILSEHGITID